MTFQGTSCLWFVLAKVLVKVQIVYHNYWQEEFITTRTNSPTDWGCYAAWRCSCTRAAAGK